MRRLALILWLAAFILIGCQETSATTREATSTRAAPADTPVIATTAPRATANRPDALLPSSITTPPTDVSQGSSSTAGPPAAASPSPMGTVSTNTVMPLRTPTLTPTAIITAGVEGALIQVTMRSQVGVLLDEFPEEMRERVATALLEQPPETWVARAQRQVGLTRLRLNYRNYRISGKGQLPLPPPELRSIALDRAGPTRQTLHGHDLVTIPYTLTTTLLTDAESASVAEPALAEIGGSWEESFLFPVDPDLLLQRTGRACINDNGFPPNSVDSENAWYFYDFSRARCPEVVAVRVGSIQSNLRFERLAWDAELAAEVRVGPVTNLEAADMRVVGKDLHTNRIIYRYIEPGDCALEEGAVNGSGWRRLLQFGATVHNVGNAPLHVGSVAASDHKGSLFAYAPCHDHVHYNHFGDFFLRTQDQVTSSKQAFCVQSTDRRSNNELSPLTHDYSCSFQGVQVGWADEYIAGLDTQWIDITELAIGPEEEAIELGFAFNPEAFLCEGKPVLDENGQPFLELSGFTTDEGVPINRERCDFIPEWDENNEAVRQLFIPPVGSFVTAVCENGEAGPLRNCGLTALNVQGVDALCSAGQPVELSLRTEAQGQPQVVRVCEWSAALDTGVACTYENSLANTIVDDQPTSITFTCPQVRDREVGADDERAGPSYALYAAPLWPIDDLLPLLPAD